MQLTLLAHFAALTDFNSPIAVFSHQKPLIPNSSSFQTVDNKPMRMQESRGQYHQYSTRGYVQMREKFEAFSLEALTKELLRVLWLARVV